MTKNATAVRLSPVSVPPSEGIAGLVSRSDLKAALGLLLPSWDVLTLSKAAHALRLWGIDAVFGERHHPSPVRSRIFTGRELLSIFLDHRFFLRFFRLEPLLRLTDYGVLVEKYSGPVRMDAGLVHVDYLLRTCAELGVPSDTSVRTCDGESTVGGMVRYSMASFDPGQELEWTVEGLARYVAPAHGWVNRFGQYHTFDETVGAILSRQRGEGSCLGTHVPYTLAVLLRIDEKEPILGDSSRAKAVEYLKEASKLLEEEQLGNGTWPVRWVPAIPEYEGVDREELRTRAGLILMGHHLEWFAMTPADLRPGSGGVRRALDFVVEAVPRLSESAVQEYYYLVSHVGKALCYYAGVDPARDYELFA